MKFVEIIQNRDGKNWPTLLNFDNGEKFIQEDYLFIKGYRICIRIYFIIYLDIKLIDRTKYKNHRLSVLNFENDKKKKKEKFVQRDCVMRLFIREDIRYLYWIREWYLFCNFIPIKFIQKKNRVERLNDKNLKTCTKEEKFAETKICYVIIYPEKYLFNWYQHLSLSEDKLEADHQPPCWRG